MTTETALRTRYEALLAETLPRVRARIAGAEAAAGRPEGSVRLVAVTKGHPVEAAQAALAAGLTDLGENRVEALETKVPLLGRDGVTWHMIGHLQRRKAARALEVADLIHSVDTLRLGERLSRLAGERGRTVPVLAQVNVAREATKSGFDPDAAVDEVAALSRLPGVDVRGLMTMAPLVDDEAVLSATFAGLRRLLERLREGGAPVGPELSMGMTHDLEIAVREGSTMVRVGTALFGPRPE